jgi:quinol monooxygenase YgiN
LDPKPDEVEVTIVTLVFDATDPERLLPVLSKYVVVSRGHPGCRNIDLTASATVAGRFVIIEKWESATSQQAHFDSRDMIEMAEACTGMLSAPPRIDLLFGISAHDLA